MASQKHLKDLLQEDQEPFHLKSYISDRRCLIEKPRTDLHIRTRKPISQNAKFGSSFCKTACFLSFNQSPDPRKSPLFGFKSCNKNPNSVFLDILEAAAKIQRQSDPITKTQNRGNAFGLFGSMLKKLKHRRKREIRDDGVRASVKEISTWDSSVVHNNFHGDIKCERTESAFETRLSCFCNEEASCLDGVNEIACETMDGVDFSDDETRFCESPFRFVLQTSSPGRRTPNFISPAASPNRRRTENKELESLKKFQSEEEDDEEEEKEQCSPVSVLETPFEDDDDHDDEDDDAMEDDDEEQCYHLKPNHAPRSKYQLLKKLSRFEELAGMSEEEQETETENLVETIIESACNELKRFPEGMKRLIYDLVAEEEENLESQETVTKRVCRRLESWTKVELNTIDMMIEHDFRQELNLWNKNREEVQEAAMEIEIAILGDLIDELSSDFVSV